MGFLSRLWRHVRFWCFTMPTLFLMVLIYKPLEFFKRIVIIDEDKLPESPHGLIVVSNHPSLWEPIVLIVVLFLHYLKRSYFVVPWSSPDLNNYTKRWWFFNVLFGSRFTTFNREASKRRQIGDLERTRDLLQAGHCVIYFPEGGRSWSDKKARRTVAPGIELRKLKLTPGWLLCQWGVTLTTVWVDGMDKVLPPGTWFPRFWRQMSITIGSTLVSDVLPPHERDRKDLNAKVEQLLIEAAQRTAVR